MEVKFSRCNHCGNVVLRVKDAGVNPVCCGEKMELLVPGSVDAAAEKHVPVVSPIFDGHATRVEVGSVAHPMAEEHYIEWIALACDGRVGIHYLKPGDEPATNFSGVEHGTVYAYCNLHGLWKAEF